MVNVCCPGLSPARLKGVTQVESFCPSIWICAPAGVEATLNCPGTIVGAVGLLGFAFFLLLYFGCTETAGGATVTASGATCVVVWFAAELSGGADALGWAGALAATAGVCTGVASSSAFSEWICHAIPATTTAMTSIAAAIETMKSCGGVFLISETAFFATS